MARFEIVTFFLLFFHFISVMTTLGMYLTMFYWWEWNVGRFRLGGYGLGLGLQYENLPVETANT